MSEKDKIAIWRALLCNSLVDSLNYTTHSHCSAAASPELSTIPCQHIELRECVCYVSVADMLAEEPCPDSSHLSSVSFEV